VPAPRRRPQVPRGGLHKPRDVRARIESANLDAIKFNLIYEGWSYPVELRLTGIHNVENALGAAACALSLGIEAQEVAAALSTFAGVPGRLERIETGNGLAVFVDYAHTDGALDTVLSSLKPLVKGRLIVVFGAGGDRDRGKRPRMAKAVEQYADFSVLTSDNPRSENPALIITEVEKGFRSNNSRLLKPDRREAIEAALNMAVSGDVVLIAGKGHEDYQIFADRVEHFDDREVVREALRKS
jgi:UDP-N-acetylmuramoyl-L-alanyl-D-glutamate--2,6-diaminopimelate ligase